MSEALREIPQISKLVEFFKNSYPEAVIKRAAREVTERIRRDIKEGKRESADNVYEEVERRIKEMLRFNLRRVINATGVVVNTNLGRAPLHPEVVAHIGEIACGYSNLEFDIEKGERGSRNTHVEGLLCDLTGAESAFVVNNNAGAVYLVLNTLALEREVVVSRGELVEIGGSFRVPDIMRSSGAILVEVGTTNRTRVSDYERAINENTALLMKVHRSNFYMEGFVEEVSLLELSSLGRRYSVPTYYDAGSGLLVYLRSLGLKSSEVTFREAIEEGIDVVSGSGDKLLGGPQAGIILGRKEILDRIKENPMARALRIDKLTLSALEKTLRLYIEERFEEIPVLRMLTEKESTIRKRALKLKRLLRGIEGLEVEVVKDVAKPGGGSLPQLELPTYCVALSHAEFTPTELQERLRRSEPPVVGRLKRNRLLLDMRTVPGEELKLIRDTLLRL